MTSSPSSASAGCGAPAASTRRTASSRRSGADRFEQVVQGADIERGDGLVVVRRHEHHRGPVREVGEHTRELDPGQAGHVDVEEDRVDRALVEFPQRRGGVAGSVHLADVGVRLEQVGQLVEGGRLVVDGEHRQAGHLLTRTHLRWPETPDRNLGTRITTFVPAPIAVSTTRP